MVSRERERELNAESDAVSRSEASLAEVQQSVDAEAGDLAKAFRNVKATKQALAKRQGEVVKKLASKSTPETVDGVQRIKVVSTDSDGSRTSRALVQELEQTVESQQENLAYFEQVLDEKDVQIESARLRVEELEHAEDLHGKSGPQEVPEHAQNIKHLRGRVADLESDLEEAVKDRKEQIEEIAHLKHAEAGATRKLSESDGKIVKLEENLNTEREGLGRLQASLDEATLRVEALEAKLRDKQVACTAEKADIDTQSKKVSQLQNAKNDLLRRFNHANGEISGLKSDLFGSKTQIEGLKGALADQERASAAEKAELEKVKRAYSSLEADNESAIEVATKQNKIARDLKKELKQLRASTEALSAVAQGGAQQSAVSTSAGEHDAVGIDRAICDQRPIPERERHEDYDKIVVSRNAYKNDREVLEEKLRLERGWHAESRRQLQALQAGLQRARAEIEMAQADARVQGLEEQP